MLLKIHKKQRRQNMTKHFYFTQEVKRHSKTYGYNDMYCNIYKINKKDGTPCSVGTCEYRTGSTRGAIHEVFAKLVELKLIPKKYHKLNKYYTSYNQNSYRIHEIY